MPKEPPSGGAPGEYMGMDDFGEEDEVKESALFIFCCDMDYSVISAVFLFLFSCLCTFWKHNETPVYLFLILVGVAALDR